MVSKTILNNLLLYSSTHALVDFACVGLVFGIFGLGILPFEKYFYLIVLYNLLAFGLQPIFGYFADETKNQ